MDGTGGEPSIKEWSTQSIPMPELPQGLISPCSTLPVSPSEPAPIVDGIYMHIKNSSDNHLEIWMSELFYVSLFLFLLFHDLLVFGRIDACYIFKGPVKMIVVVKANFLTDRSDGNLAFQ